MKATTQSLKKEAEAKLKKETSAVFQKMTKEENDIKSRLMAQIKDTESKLNKKLSQEH